jgi:hypothetical protein
MNRPRFITAALAAALLVSETTAAATLPGAISGTVRIGAAGQPVAGATVTATSENALRYASETDSEGSYRLQELPPGIYLIEFDAEGAEPSHRAVHVRGGVSETVDMVLSAGSTERASGLVMPSPAMLETSEVRSAYPASFVDRLPGSRTLRGAALLAPGVSDTGFGFRGRKDYLVISGAPASDNLFLVDGTVVNENVRGQAHNLYIEDAVEEITILSGAISAEYGRFTGGVISTVTRSGTNRLSGSLRDTVTNPAWSGSRHGIERPDQVHHSLEATLGGRIVPDRLWFFAAGRYFDTEQRAYLADSTIPYTVSTEEARYEGKLTGQLSIAHSLIASRSSSEVAQRNSCLFGCMETTTVDPEIRRPAVYSSVRYSGLLRQSLILDVGWSRKDFTFIGYGGESTDPSTGSWGYDVTRKAYFGAPVFCGICDDEQRDSRNGFAKATHDLATRRGMHSIVIGYEQWVEQNLRNNHQSASAYGVVTLHSVERDLHGTVRPAFAPGTTYITWHPVLAPSEGSESVTGSLFINDRWDLSSRWSLNLGARYDRSSGHNSAGDPLPESGLLSPRLGLAWDARGDGITRVNATYGRYVTRLAGIVADAVSPGGTPAYFSWSYEGPAINDDRTLDSRGAMSQLFDWFFQNGGTGRTPEFAFLPLNAIVSPSLRPLNVDEWTLGFSRQVGRTGFFRMDYIDREWSDFYSLRTDLSTGVQISSGQRFDRSILENTNALSRDYSAVQFQGTFRPAARIHLGGAYTWSKLRGNADVETLALGPRADPAAGYPEYRAFPRSNPAGYLPSDQRHKLRVWAETSFATRVGELSVSMLHRFESGTPYEMVADVRPFVQNPGYATPPARVPYYFSDRGAFRWDDLSATDTAVNLQVPAGPAIVFLRGEALNVFDNRAQVGGDTTILTALHAPRVLTLFNPGTTTPVEGVHYRKGPNFGKPTSMYHYQQPRTLQLSLGVRF